jgi:hypothetical protein
MHPYATDSTKEREIVPLIIAVLSILLALALDQTLTILKIKVPWWLDAPAVVGFYGILYKAYDKWIWRLPILKKLKIAKTPDLNGTWKGYAISSYDNHGIRHDATIKIKQDWTSISIQLQAAQSKSNSTIANITTQNHQDTTISYQYTNEPAPGAKGSMQIHKGTANLTLAKKGHKETLEGDYYSGRGRQNHGQLHFTKNK